MNQQEIAAIITIARRAPLKNMDEAAAVDQLLRKLSEHFSTVPNVVENKDAPSNVEQVGASS